MSRARLGAAFAVAAATVALAAPTATATAATEVATEAGRIAEVRVDDGRLTVVFQADGLSDGVTVDGDSVVVRVSGRAVEATAEPLSDNAAAVSRTAVLAIDNSRSMNGERLDAAKTAAKTFLDTLPDDVAAGLVTFGDSAAVAVEATVDRAKVEAAIDGIVLNETLGTALFDASALASDATGDDGARSVLLMTDGDEAGASSRLTLEEAAEHATDDGVNVDAVYIGEEAQPPAELQQLVALAGGQVVTSATAELAGVFEQAAEAISAQLLIEAPLPAGLAGSGTVVVSARAGDLVLTDSTFATLTDSGPSGPSGRAKDFGPRAVDAGSASTLLGARVLPFLLGALFIALLVLVYVALGAFRRDDRTGRIRRRLSVYTLTGRPPVQREAASTALGASHVARSAVELAGRFVQKRDFEAGLERKLEAAGVPLRAAEWLLIHIGVAVLGGILLLLVSGGNLAAAVLGLAIGLGAPVGYLVVKESRRTSAFLAQLPDTLQLVSGSLSAGYSIPQSLDSVVREGTQPISGEFNRALVEARLGVPVEDAMDGVAERMRSKDFAWVVMAIRIQREVGGNLAELLSTVAGTLRERDRLRRQVKVLSAEGRLSAWILGLLPPVFASYLLLVRPSYLQPLVSGALGWLMIGTSVTLLAVGALWLSRVVKVEV